MCYDQHNYEVSKNFVFLFHHLYKCIPTKYDWNELILTWSFVPMDLVSLSL